MSSISMSRSLMRLLPCCLVLVGALLQPEAVEAQFGRRPGGFSGGGFSGGRGGGFSSRGRTGGGGGGGGLLGAAQRESVQAELKLTDEQKTQISEIAEAARANRDSFSFGDMRNASEEERAAIFADMRAKQEEQRKAAEEQLKGVLSPQQFQRLEQLSLHSAGVRGLLGESVATELKLTDEQKTQMEEILNAPPDADFRSMSSEEQEKWRADRDARVLAVLSDEQKQAWQAKLGPPPVELAQADSAAASSTTGASTSTTTAGAAAPAASTTEPPPGETVVSSFGGPSDSDEPHGPLETLSFNFRYAPWEDVLRLFADAAGLTLDLHDVPPGTFSYYDKNEYTPTEALDALNGYLLPKGYLLVRRNNFLVSLNIDNGIPPNLVPVVRPSELEERGNNELLSVIIPLPGTDAQKVSEEVGALIGPQGKVVALTSSNSLFVQDIGSNLRRIRDLIEGMEGPVDPEALTFKSFALKYIPANDAERHIRSLFGLQAGTPNVSSGSRSSSSWSRYSRDSRDSQNSRDSRDSRPEPPASASTGMTVASDLRMNSLLVTATPTELKVVEQILQSLDVPEDPDAAKIGNSSVPTLRVYTVREADPREVTKTLDAIMPGVVVNEDGRNGFIHIRATAAEHVQVEDLIRRLDGQGSQMVDIIRLSKFDPLAMSSLLNNLFVKDGENAPTIHAELQTRTLLVRGSAEQITQVRKTLQAYGEDGTGGPAARQGGRFRSIPLAGRDPERLARMVETILNGSPEFTNEIRVVVPNEAPVDRPQERVPSATERPPRRSERDANQDAASRSPLPPRNSRRAGLTLSPDDDDDTAADVVLTTPISTGIGGDLFAESQDARETQQTAPADDQQADGDSADDESDEAENSPTRQTNPAPVASPAAPEQRAPAQATQATPRESSPPAAARPRVSIEVRGDDLFLYSADEAALDQVEDLIGSLAEQITPRNTWTVFYLRVANAADVASMLQQLMPDSFVTSTGGTDSSFLGSMSALGGQLLDLAGMGGAGAYPTSLRIVTDARTNALYVTGPVSQVRDVEQFLKILDTSELPGSLRARVPRTIDVLYADVNEIAAMIREIYKDFLEDPAASQRNRDRGNPLAAMFGGGGAVSTNNDTSRPAGIRLTLAVDARTNQLIVSCDDSLFREIEQLVAERDRAAYDAEPTVRIVTLDDANMTLVQQALTTLSPKIVVSTSGSRSPSQPGQASTRGPSSTSSDNRPGDDDMLREMFRQRMMERAREGGGDSGSRSAGPPSGGSSGGNGRPSFRSGGGAPSSGGFRGSSGGFRGSSGGSRGSSRGGR